MASLDSLPLDSLTPSRLWAVLDRGTRTAAARALYARASRAGDAGRADADLAIARALRFRESAVRRLPVEQRVQYLSRAARPDDTLAASLLIALHLAARSRMLAAFLDALGIPHDDGLIREDHRLEPPATAVLEAAVDRLFETFPAEEVGLYLASLLAVDPDTWGGLLPLLGRRLASGSAEGAASPGG